MALKYVFKYQIRAIQYSDVLDLYIDKIVKRIISRLEEQSARKVKNYTVLRAKGCDIISTEESDRLGGDVISRNISEETCAAFCLGWCRTGAQFPKGLPNVSRSHQISNH